MLATNPNQGCNCTHRTDKGQEFEFASVWMKNRSWHFQIIEIVDTIVELNDSSSV